MVYDRNVQNNQRLKTLLILYTIYYLEPSYVPVTISTINQHFFSK